MQWYGDEPRNKKSNVEAELAEGKSMEERELLVSLAPPPSWIHSETSRFLISADVSMRRYVRPFVRDSVLRVSVAGQFGPLPSWISDLGARPDYELDI